MKTFKIKIKNVVLDIGKDRQELSEINVNDFGIIVLEEYEIDEIDDVLVEHISDLTGFLVHSIEYEIIN